MEVVKTPEILLSNYEVLSLLKEVNTSSKKEKKQHTFRSNLATIVYETTKYLEDSNAAQIKDDETFRDLLLRLKEFNLTKSEKLDIVNHLPTSLVELQLMIEDSEERFTEEAMQDILDIVSSFINQELERQPDQDEMQEESDMKEEDDSSTGNPIMEFKSEGVCAESEEAVEVSVPFPVKTEST
jgi:DNA-directed RNA polymerase subunit F